MTDQDTIATLLHDAARSGYDEVTIRMSSYDPPRWQAIAKHRDRTKAWAVSVDPIQAKALTDALTKAVDAPPGVPTAKPPRARKRVTVPVPEPVAPAPRKRARPGA